MHDLALKAAQDCLEMAEFYSAIDEPFFARQVALEGTEHMKVVQSVQAMWVKA